MRTILTGLAIILMPFLLWGKEDPENGKVLFRNYCKACHNIDKNLVGPALKDVHERRTEDWIYAFIKGSNGMIEAGDTTAMSLFMQYNQIPMPDQNLSDDQISDILSYIIFESDKEPEVQLISRPELASKQMMEPLHFGDFRFWIVYTITVVIMIGVLYYMVEITSLSKKIREGK